MNAVARPMPVRMLRGVRIDRFIEVHDEETGRLHAASTLTTAATSASCASSVGFLRGMTRRIDKLKRIAA